MTPEEIYAIVGGYHGDAFRVLGPHEVEDGWEVRAFLPHASAATVVAADGEAAMKKVHTSGFYVAAFKKRPKAYRIASVLSSGGTVELEDPYRFASVIDSDLLRQHSDGVNFASYEFLGSRLISQDGVDGALFAVWAPNALNVTLMGSFNDWDERCHPMRLREGGVWEFFLPGVKDGDTYKYNIRSKYAAYQQQKADPYGLAYELPPKSASVVTSIDGYAWSDSEWMEERAAKDLLKEPVSIYELHLESWLRGPNREWTTYRELATKLVEYVKRMGYTHIELMPPAEHPFSGSWGYQVIGYFAPTSRFGTPRDFMHLVDQCHRNGIGVIIDWVPAHFPKDAHGLAYFDGTALYEHADPRKGEHRDWGTLIFNFGRNEVLSFLISNALFWLKKYHIDGLRVDAVASMLYLDYSRNPGDWEPNEFGGRENLEAIRFLRLFNEQAHLVPGAITIAEESTAFPGVSKPTYLNGLGFTMKWNMGWMHDMLEYFSKEPVYRKFHHNDITFSLLYAFTENFVLPVSHDEVVHLKRSLLNKMPGDEWQRFANVRAFLGFMYGHPGKKLLFMGSEIGQPEEWDHDGSVAFDLLNNDLNRKLQCYAKDLNHFYTSHPALYEVDASFEGFEWVDFHDVESSVISFLRYARDRNDFLLFVCNFTPIVRANYRVGVPVAGHYREVLNSDSSFYGGSNVVNSGDLYSEAIAVQGRLQSLRLTLPPLAVIVFQCTA
jgi:1,4-alpha-glucan branching enzyme